MCVSSFQREEVGDRGFPLEKMCQPGKVIALGRAGSQAFITSLLLVKGGRKAPLVAKIFSLLGFN